MSLFKNMLAENESLFKDATALDYDYLPKMIPHREDEQRVIAECIKPLFANRNGRNATVTGAPGIGKTAACKHILREIEEQTDEIQQVYVSCWQKNSTFKILTEICHQIGYNLTHNKRTDELFSEIKRIINKSTAVFVFDEIDKAEDNDFLYMILEEIYKKTIITITNYDDWLINLDERIKSRLMPEKIEFKPYTLSETEAILKDRLHYAFFDDVISDNILKAIAKKAFERGDIRTGLHLLRESANNAENKARRSITMEDAQKAFEKLIEFKKKDAEKLEAEEKSILELVKNSSSTRIGDLFKEYQKTNPNVIYKTFQRKIKKLNENGFLSTKKIPGGKEGNTTVIEYDSTKKLTEF